MDTDYIKYPGQDSFERDLLIDVKLPSGLRGVMETIDLLNNIHELGHIHGLRLHINELTLIGCSSGNPSKN